MPEIRQLAAVMFTDVVGYTTLMGWDEAKALETIKFFRQSIEKRAEEHEGKIIQYYGDGCLLLFNSSVNAVEMAKKLQSDFSEPPGVSARIGIHMGEVLLKDENVFGDAVNISSRIQSLAPPGGIYISETVHRNISNKKINAKFISEEILKNVKEPMRIYEIVTKNIMPEIKHAIKIPQKSIAVLPFVNMSNDPEQEYFSDGMAEEILNSLAHLNDLKVAGRTSSFQFKGKNIDLREVGEKLCVSTVLEGSVRKQGNRLRVTSQLVNVEDGFHIWSERYDRDMDDIFAIQDEIAGAITENLKIIFLDKEKEMIIKNPTENKEAYELYLKGRFFYNKRGVYLKNALNYFYQAVDMDPKFALAYAGIADSYALLSFFAILPPQSTMLKAKFAAERSVQLDPARAEAYTALAFINGFYDWNWTDARENFRKAFDRNLNYSQAYNWYCLYIYFGENNLEEGLKAAITNVDLEPLAATPHNLKAAMLGMMGKYEEALHEIGISLELDPDYYFTYLYKAEAYIKLLNYDAALAALNKGLTLSGRHQWAMAFLCWLYVQQQKNEEAQKIYDELLERKKSEYISGWFLFISAYSLKKYDEAFEFLDMAFDEKLPLLITCRSELWPISKQLKSDQRFLEAIKRIGFPE